MLGCQNKPYRCPVGFRPDAWLSTAIRIFLGWQTFDIPGALFLICQELVGKESSLACEKARSLSE
jgi:hypothetical protein